MENDVHKGLKTASGILTGAVGRMGRILKGMNSLFSRKGKDSSGRLESLKRKVPEERKAAVGSFSELQEEFSCAANNLSELADMSHNLVDCSEKLLQIALGKDDSSLLERAAETLITWLRGMDENREKTILLLDSLDRQSVLISEVLQLEDTLQRAVAPMKIFPALLKIEASSLPAEKQQFFMVLADEIKGLKDRVSDSLDRQFRHLQQINGKVREGIRLYCLPLRAQCDQINKGKIEIEEALAAIRADLERNHERDVKLLDVSKRIEGEVMKSVMALQYQDISGQQLQHVMEALEEIEIGFADLRTGRFRKYQMEKVQFLHEASLIQKAHVEHAGGELERASRTVGGSFDAVVEAIRELDADCISMQDFQSVTVSSEGIVQKLLDGKADVIRLNEGFVNSVSKVMEFIRPLEGTAANLTSAMRELSAQIRLIALNAQVQAATLGDGTGLEVLSMKTCQVSDEIYEIGNSLSNTLSDLSHSLCEDVARCADLEKVAYEIRTAIDLEGEELESGLHFHRDKALEALMELGASSDAIVNKVNDVTGQRMFSKHPLEHLARVSTFLEESSAAFAPESLGVSFALGLGEASERLRENYTMEAEHKVHDLSLGIQRQPARKDPVTPAPATEEIEDFLFFGEEEPAAEPKEELATVAAAAEDEFGDNVELF